MKKLTMLAVAVMCGTSAFAQDVYKQLSKIKDYNEAYNLLKGNLGSISSEEKAKCYNVLVDLAYDKVVKEQATITSNQMAEQMGTKVEPYDTVGLYNAVMLSLENGVLCDQFDNEPNLKGKIKPKFHSSNANRLYPIRLHLINAGIYYQAIDQNLSYKFLSTYVESDAYPLFKEQDRSKDNNLTQIAYYAARDAYLLKDYNKAEYFADIASNDADYGKEAQQLKLAVMQAQLKTHEDSVNYVNKLKEIYAKDETNDVIFSTICSMLLATNDKAGMTEMMNAKLAKDPNNFTALALLGQLNMNERNWDGAIEALQKAASIESTNPAVVASIGNCYMYKAQEAAEKAAAKTGNIAPAAEKVIIGVYEQAIQYLEKARDMDVKSEFKNVWAYSLYTCCYRAYGPDDAKTIAAEAYTK